MPIPKSVLEKYKNEVFVETGTLNGEGVQAALDCGFREVHSIDIDKSLVDAQIKKYAGQPDRHFYAGSSATLLPGILKDIQGRITFWLDAHADGALTLKNTPVLGELKAIDDYICCLTHPDYYPTIMVDDMRLFSAEDKAEMTRLLGRYPGIVTVEDTVVAPRDVLVYIPRV